MSCNRYESSVFNNVASTIRSTPTGSRYEIKTQLNKNKLHKNLTLLFFHSNAVTIPKSIKVK